jgi:hypothetical protein
MMLEPPKKKRRTLGSHQSARMISDTWLTPPHVIAALGGARSFDLDPASPITRPWPTAKRHYTIIDDGLAQPWRGRTWLNPPFGPPKQIAPWLKRMAAHNHGTLLIAARTETIAFFDFVWNRATALLFLRGRLYFHDAAGVRAKANCGAPIVLAAYGKRDAGILRNCGLDGQFIQLRQ